MGNLHTEFNFLQSSVFELEDARDRRKDRQKAMRNADFCSAGRIIMT